MVYWVANYFKLEAEVLDDRGAVVWCWHPLRECETAIPKEWILWNDNGKNSVL